MKEMSEDEDEDFVMVEENKVDEAKVEAARVAREERQKRLRDMMDDDDEPMAEASPVEEAVDEDSPIDSTQKTEEPQEVVTVTDGRRRGRRRVMKKKTVQDEEGYLGEVFVCMIRCEIELTHRSNQGRGCLGVLLRGRTTGKEGKDGSFRHGRKGQEICWQAGAGKHHVLLFKEVRGTGNDLARRRFPTTAVMSLCRYSCSFALK
jgi:hypothetical protein